MTINVFGSGDILALPKLDMCRSSFGSEVHYTKPDYRSFYSQYGFAVPLNYEAIPYDLIMDGRLPKTSDHVSRFENICDYLLIGHDGLLWRASLMLRSDGFKLSHSYIERHTVPGWWFAVSPETLDSDGDKLIGFLYTEPTQEMIDEYFSLYQLGKRIHWCSISTIVETLHREFPLDGKEDVSCKQDI